MTTGKHAGATPGFAVGDKVRLTRWCYAYAEGAPRGKLPAGSEGEIVTCTFAAYIVGVGIYRTLVPADALEAAQGGAVPQVAP